MTEWTPELRLMLVLEAALEQFDEANRVAPDAHAKECDCELCAFVAAIREALSRPPGS